ncbi:MAG: hypothetical protein IPL29_02340 [Propionivibrio sp.]|nr:hypothetical protein [Propionivibrio sp.]
MAPALILWRGCDNSITLKYRQPARLPYRKCGSRPEKWRERRTIEYSRPRLASHSDMATSQQLSDLRFVVQRVGSGWVLRALEQLARDEPARACQVVDETMVNSLNSIRSFSSMASPFRMTVVTVALNLVTVPPYGKNSAGADRDDDAQQAAPEKSGQDRLDPLPENELRCIGH